MDSRTFKSFVKTAMALQADDDTPSDYVMTRAAVEAKFPKLASLETEKNWQRDERKLLGVGGAIGGGLGGYLLGKQFRATPKQLAALSLGGAALFGATNYGGAALGHYISNKIDPRFKEKKAGYANHLELAGLGTLAAPAVAGLAHHPMSEKKKEVAEVAGLGILAAPYAHNLAAKKSARYAASRVGQKLTHIFGH